jgi:hypothetical protein
MDCRKACSMAGPFIQNRIPIQKLEDFLNHIEKCSECKEELELDYSLNLILYTSANEAANFDVKDALEDLLLEAEQKVFYWKVWERFKYILTTIVVWCVILTGCLQIYQWIH